MWALRTGWMPGCVLAGPELHDNMLSQLFGIYVCTGLICKVCVIIIAIVAESARWNEFTEMNPSRTCWPNARTNFENIWQLCAFNTLYSARCVVMCLSFTHNINLSYSENPPAAAIRFADQRTCESAISTTVSIVAADVRTFRTQNIAHKSRLERGDFTKRIHWMRNWFSHTVNSVSHIFTSSLYAHSHYSQQLWAMTFIIVLTIQYLSEIALNARHASHT